MPRIFITGCGIFVPGGADLPMFWKTLLRGKSTVQQISSFDATGYPTRIAAEISKYDPHRYFSPKQIRRTERYTQYALIAARQAMKDAAQGLEEWSSTSVGVYEGSSLGPTAWFLDQHEIFLEKGYKRANPLALAIGFPGAASSNVAAELNINGTSSATTGGSVASILGLASAYNAMKLGRLDRALVLGSEAPIHPAILASFCSVRAMSRRNQNPAAAFRPFDRTRDGFVLGEGAGAIVLETERHVVQRGKRPYAELKSIGITCDNYHMTAPDPEGTYIAKAMRMALLEAGLLPETIDYFSAHGTGTKLNDAVEATALQSVFGDYAHTLPVSSIKGTIGHLLGACGLVEIVANVLSLQNHKVPPTANLTNLDKHCRLNIVSDKPLSTRLNHIMSNNYSFGGKNTSVILSVADNLQDAPA